MKSISYTKSVAYVLLTSALAFPGLSLAKEIPLYQEPKAGASSIGTADLSYGVIPIFTSKDGNWVKIGDPRNGNVGWVKASELNSNDGSSFIFSHQVSGDDKNSSSYQVFQFGTPAKLTPEQEKTLKKIEEAQAASRKAMQRAMQEMMNSWDRMIPSPIIMPVIVVPQRVPDASVTSTHSGKASSPSPTSKKSQ